MNDDTENPPEEASVGDPVLRVSVRVLGDVEPAVCAGGCAQ